MFKKLSNIEIDLYREWARQNYVPHDNINTCWHPVVQEECININKEQNEENNPTR